LRALFLIVDAPAVQQRLSSLLAVGSAPVTECISIAKGRPNKLVRHSVRLRRRHSNSWWLGRDFKFSRQLVRVVRHLADPCLEHIHPTFERFMLGCANGVRLFAGRYKRRSDRDKDTCHPLQAHPGPLVHFLSAAMQLSPHAFPARQTLQQPPAAHAGDAAPTTLTEASASAASSILMFPIPPATRDRAGRVRSPLR
jgi:hypothetical protein